jgi:acetyl esterase/lipase
VSEGAAELNLDLARYTVGGSSAGANLAAVMAQKLLSRPEISSKLKVLFQLLVVPVTDNTATVETNPTWKDCEFTPALPALKMMWYRRHYLPDEETWTETDASPLLFPAEKFAELPPAQVLVGELDVLRHEGEEYARKLRDAGVPAEVEVMKGMPHRKSALRGFSCCV